MIVFKKKKKKRYCCLLTPELAFAAIFPYSRSLTFLELSVEDIRAMTQKRSPRKCG